MPEISIKCINCRWIGTSKTKKSKYVCESCGSEAEEVPEVVKKEEPQPQVPVIKVNDLSNRRKKAILLLRKFVYNLFAARFDEVVKTSITSYRPMNLSIEQIKISLLVELEGMLHSGKLDDALCPIKGDSWKIGVAFNNLFGRYSYYDSNISDVDRMMSIACQSYYDYCTNPDIIEEN